MMQDSQEVFMKVVLILTFIIAVIMTAGIGSLVIFEVLTFDQGLDFLLKTLAAVILLGASSAVIALVIGSKNTSSE